MAGGAAAARQQLGAQRERRLVRWRWPRMHAHCCRLAVVALMRCSQGLMKP